MIESEKWIIDIDTENDNLINKKKVQFTEEQKKVLEKNIKYLEDNFEWFNDKNNFDEEWFIYNYKELLEHWYDEWNYTLDLCFPTEDDYYNIKVDDFNNYIEEYRYLRFEQNIYLTKKYAYLKILPNFLSEEYESFYFNCWKIKTNTNISISIEESSFIPALDMVQEDWYNEDRWIYPSWNNSYLFIEKEWWNDLTIKECIDNIAIYKYLAETKLGLTLVNDTLLFDNSENKHDDTFILEWDYIKDYPMDCIKDYIEAKAITNPKVRYTLLFRVLEYISVSSNHAELIENVNTKLKEFEWKSIKWTDIKEIVWIIKSKKITDDYIKTLLDMISIKSFIDLLPTYIKDKVFDGIDIDIKKLSSFLTNTRHRYSHAKPNYNIKEYECKDEDIEEFNIFIDKLVQESIDWYINLDDYLKIK